MPTLRRTPSGAYKSRQRVPKDVADEYGQLYGQRLEVKLHIPAGTSEGIAKQRFAEWLAEHEGRVAAIRAAQKGEGRSLTEYEARKLAGEWYAWWIARNSQAAAIQVEHWQDQVQSALLEAGGARPKRGGNPDDLWDQDADVREAVRPVLADVGETAQFLAGRGLVLDNPSRAMVLDFLYHDLAAALRLFVRRARGDYSPDHYAERFPQVTTTSDDGLTPWQLFERWRDERKPAQSTIENWKNFFEAMSHHFEGRSAGSLSVDEARVWVKGLATPKRSIGTVRNTWLRALNTVFNWAVDERLVPANPFAGLKLTVPKRQTLRETKAFHDAEAAIILRAAMNVTDTSSPFDAARRYVPWLCAYSGARPGEVTQLRGEDVFERDGVWAMRLTPDAGTVKTRKARVVPLHEHLLEQGFLQFVRSHGAGPLFYTPDPRAHPHKKPRAAQTRQRLAAWVRGLGVSDKEVSPNHGWRHTFKQVAERVGITERMSDYITGHSAKSVSRTYGEPTLSDMAEALKRFPRYSTEGRRVGSEKAA